MSTDSVNPLRQRMTEDMSARKLNPHTQRSHISSCKRFAAYLKRSPDTATADEIRLFQLHLLEERIPARHLLRRINPIATRVLGDLRGKLQPFYSEIGRPSIDPELMMRMLMVGRRRRTSASSLAWPQLHD